jgi:hypothetical protein
MNSTDITRKEQKKRQSVLKGEMLAEECILFFGNVPSLVVDRFCLITGPPCTQKHFCKCFTSIEDGLSSWPSLHIIQLLTWHKEIQN